MIIYKTTNIINGKIYIGKDSKNDENYLGSGKLLHRAIKKYGLENFKKETLDCANSIEELNEREIYWISFFNSFKRNIGYNIALGGTGGNTLENHPNKENIYLAISKANKVSLSGKKLSEEIKMKIRLANLGKVSGNKGKKLSQAMKDKISKSKIDWYKNNTISDETRLKISLGNVGKVSKKKGIKNEIHSKFMKENNPFLNKKHSEESRAKMSKSLTGKKFSKEHCENLSLSLKNKIPVNRVKIIIDDQNFISMFEASSILKINYSTLRNRLKSKNYKNYISL